MTIDRATSVELDPEDCECTDCKPVLNIANAPTIDNLKQFRAFVESRFADDEAQS